MEHPEFGGAETIRTLGINRAGLNDGFARTELRHDGVEHTLHGGRVGDDDLDEINRTRDIGGGRFPLRKIGFCGAVPGTGQDASRVIMTGPDRADDAEAEDADGVRGRAGVAHEGWE